MSCVRLWFQKPISSLRGGVSTTLSPSNHSPSIMIRMYYMLKKKTTYIHLHIVVTMMLLALSKRKRAALEIVFCFTYCKMNQRFILWRLLFCWYWQYDRSIYILNMCVVYIWCSMRLWWLGRISGWLFTLTGQHEHRATWKLPHFLFRLAKAKVFQLLCKRQWRRQLLAGGDHGKCFRKHSSLCFVLQRLKILQHQQETEDFFFLQSKRMALGILEHLAFEALYLRWCCGAFKWRLTG